MHLLFKSSPITLITIIYYTTTTIFNSIHTLAFLGHLFQFQNLDLAQAMKEQGLYSPQLLSDVQNNTSTLLLHLDSTTPSRSTSSPLLHTFKKTK